MNININKVYITLKTQQIRALYYPLAAFGKNGYIDEIIIVIREEDRAELQDMIIDEYPGKPVKITIGGDNRYDSVYNGLLKAAGDIVLIHDGARPLLKQRFISVCVEAMDKYPGAIVGVKNIDRICFVDENDYVVELKSNGTVYRVQTPQCFHAGILKECHERVTDKRSVTDDSTLLEKCGYKVKMLPGDATNIKITVPADVFIAEHYISLDKEILDLPALRG